MNSERLTQLRDHLAALPPERFRLSSWFRVNGETDAYELHQQGLKNKAALEGSCGTTACIAGHALALFAPEEVIPELPMRIAGKILGISDDQASDLFTPRGDTQDLATTEDAVRTIDHLIETGEVRWDV